MNIDWGFASSKFDNIKDEIDSKDITCENEAQTRFQIIDRLIKEVLCWEHAEVVVEDRVGNKRYGYVDYVLKRSDWNILIEAKKYGSTFPSPTKKKRIKLSSGILKNGLIADAIAQADEYSKEIKADFIVVTNGKCWCLYSTNNLNASSEATMLHPFDDYDDAETLFNLLSTAAIDKGSLSSYSNEPIIQEDRLLAVFNEADARVDRNNIADYITPALENALHSDAIISDTKSLKNCFVDTDIRTKYDSILGMHLSDTKPVNIQPAKRIKKDTQHGEFSKLIENSLPSHSTPVTLLIGSVGSGKSIYLKHFEKISGAEALSNAKAHWIYLDFEEMGKSGNPREFIYRNILNYLQNDNPQIEYSYKAAVEKSYEATINSLIKGPLSSIAKNQDLLDKHVADFKINEYNRLEPYVDKVLGYLAKIRPCFLVLDNIDLYEDDELEKQVFSEGLALSKRLFCSVIVSIRDATFVKHKTNSVFDAYELRKFWMYAPPLREVLSKRLTYSRLILQNKKANITLHNGANLKVNDLGVFFDIVKESVLKDQSGDFIESIADNDIRKGIGLIKNFLTSGHIEADIALRNYLSGDTKFYFPYHEVFRGSMLGQWRYFKEERTEGVNIFDSRLGSKRLRLLRFFLLNYFVNSARSQDTAEVNIRDLYKKFHIIGASDKNIIESLRFLAKHKLIRNVSSEEISDSSSCVATKSGGYYSKILSGKFVYAEECMYDTAIDNKDIWNKLYSLTSSILSDTDKVSRMKARKERMSVFINYLLDIERPLYSVFGDVDPCLTMKHTAQLIMADTESALQKTLKYSKISPRRH